MVKFFEFLWGIIATIKDTIISVISFIKDLITLLPDFFNFLPSEIKVVLIPIIAIIIAISIYKLIK